MPPFVQHTAYRFLFAVTLLICRAAGVQPSGAGRAATAGLFESHQDVGAVLHAGSVAFDPVSQSYTIAGSGENMWGSQDAFHFAWKKTSGDLVLSADVSFVGAGTDPHRKAVLMVRQSLDADSAYVDVALHGDGLTSLQFRDKKRAATAEVKADVKAPDGCALKSAASSHSGLFFTPARVNPSASRAPRRRSNSRSRSTSASVCVRTTRTWSRRRFSRRSNCKRASLRRRRRLARQARRSTGSARATTTRIS